MQKWNFKSLSIRRWLIPLLLSIDSMYLLTKCKESHTVTSKEVGEYSFPMQSKLFMEHLIDPVPYEDSVSLIKPLGV